MSDKIRIVLCDDHPLVLDGLQSLLAGVPDMDVVATANGERALDECLLQSIPDILLLDLHLGDGDGMELCKKVNKQFPHVRIIGFSAVEDYAVVSHFLKAGAQGYVLKTAPSAQIIEAIKRVAAGETFLDSTVAMAMMKQSKSNTTSQSQYVPRLSMREKEVLKLILQERTTSEIAETLFISTNTVETHRNHLMQKLGARNLAGLVRIAIEKGLAD